MHRLALVALLAFVSSALHAGTRTWTGAAGDRWSNPANWDSGMPVAGDDLVFTKHAPAYTFNDRPAGTTFRSILASAGPWTFDGNAIALTHGMSAQTTMVAFPIEVSTSQQWTAVCCHIITFIRAIDLNGQTLTLRTNVLDGDSGIELAAPMTGTGTIVMAAQQVLLGIDGALPSGAAIVHNAGTLDMRDKTASVRSFEMSADAIFAAGSKPLVVSERVRLGGTLTLRNAVDGMTIIRNDGTAPVEGSFAHVPQNVLVSYAGGDGNDVVVRVSGALTATATALTSAMNPANAGSPVTFTASVTSSSGPPSGTVTFRDNGATLATVPLNASGVASFTTAALSAGTHQLTATYDGSPSHAASASSVLTQVIVGRRRRAVSHGG